MWPYLIAGGLGLVGYQLGQRAAERRVILTGAQGGEFDAQEAGASSEGAGVFSGALDAIGESLGTVGTSLFGGPKSPCDCGCS